MTGLKLRQAEPRDMPALYELHRQQLKRDRTNYPLPELFDEKGYLAENIPLALVAEDRTGVLGAVIFEDKGLEMMLVGCSPRLTAVVRRHRHPVLYTLRQMGYRWIRVLVARSVPKPARNRLMRVLAGERGVGFRREDLRFASFFKEI